MRSNGFLSCCSLLSFHSWCLLVFWIAERLWAPCHNREADSYRGVLPKVLHLAHIHMHTQAHTPSNSHTVTGTRLIIQSLIISIPGYITEVAFVSGEKKRLVKRTCRKSRAFERISSGHDTDATFLKHLKLLENHFSAEYLNLMQMQRERRREKKCTHTEPYIQLCL